MVLLLGLLALSQLVLHIRAAAAAGGAAVEISWLSHPVRTNATVLVAGSGFSGGKVQLRRGRGGEAEVLQLTATSVSDSAATFVLPAAAGGGGDGFPSWNVSIDGSNELAVNAPEVWWWQVCLLTGFPWPCHCLSSSACPLSSHCLLTAPCHSPVHWRSLAFHCLSSSACPLPFLDPSHRLSSALRWGQGDLGRDASVGGTLHVFGRSVGTADEPAAGGGGLDGPATQERLLAAVGLASRRECCQFADALSPSLLKHLLKVEGGAAE